MRKALSLLLTVIMVGMCVACKAPIPEPQISQMKAICQLAVMECYYHNVAKYTQEDATGMWFWAKDKKFWIEYSGIVTLGIDVSLVTIEVKGTQVTITLPPAKVLGCKVDPTSLTKESFIVDKSSASIKADDETQALKAAQNKLEEAAAGDTALLANAQQRAQLLLEDYVANIGNAVGKKYSVKWVYIGVDGKQVDTDTEVSPSQPNLTEKDKKQ